MENKWKDYPKQMIQARDLFNASTSQVGVFWQETPVGQTVHVHVYMNSYNDVFRVTCSEQEYHASDIKTNGFIDAKNSMNIIEFPDIDAIMKEISKTGFIFLAGDPYFNIDAIIEKYQID